jgi:lipopolysaccharide transport system ATP-binding protein
MALVRALDLGLKIPTTIDSNKSLRSLVTQKLVRGSKGNIDGVQVLSNVNFELNNGDRVALYGGNGCGKTTLLRLIAGIYVPTAGKIQVDGKVHSLISLGTGLHPDLTGEENIRRMCLFTRPDQKIDDDYLNYIAEFSELGEFLKMPVRTYSAGMRLRLISGSIFRNDIDVFAVDEFFGVGDESFSNKVQKSMQSMISDAKIFVLASHSKELIRKHCNRLFFFDNGKVEEKDINHLS